MLQKFFFCLDKLLLSLSPSYTLALSAFLYIFCTTFLERIAQSFVVDWVPGTLFLISEMNIFSLFTFACFRNCEHKVNHIAACLLIKAINNLWVILNWCQLQNEASHGQKLRTTIFESFFIDLLRKKNSVGFLRSWIDNGSIL